MKGLINGLKLEWLKLFFAIHILNTLAVLLRYIEFAVFYQ